MRICTGEDSMEDLKERLSQLDARIQHIRRRL